MKVPNAIVTIHYRYMWELRKLKAAHAELTMKTHPELKEFVGRQCVRFVKLPVPRMAYFSRDVVSAAKSFNFFDPGINDMVK